MIDRKERYHYSLDELGELTKPERQQPQLWGHLGGEVGACRELCVPLKISWLRPCTISRSCCRNNEINENEILYASTDLSEKFNFW